MVRSHHKYYKYIHELTVSLDRWQPDLHDAAPGVAGEGLDHGCLARPRGAVEQQAELVGEARDAELSFLLPELVHELEEGLLAREENVLESLLVAEPELAVLDCGLAGVAVAVATVLGAGG